MRLILSTVLAALVSLTLGAPRDAQQGVINCFSEHNITQSNPLTDQANFTAEIAPYNKRIPYTPAALALPTTVPQVQAAVACAVKNALPVAARSGGHSYANHGLGGEDGHVVIDMKRFNHIELDKTTNIVTVGPGTRLGNVANQIFDENRRALSHGTCPTVAVGGHSLVGGYGFASRTHGLMSDSMVEATVVLANSTLVAASPEQNPDLFWALRGAGSSFGIVTSYKFKTFEAPEQNLVFSYNVTLTGDSFIGALAALQNYSMNHQPREMNIRFTARSSDTSLLGVYYGSQGDYDKAIKPLLDIFPETEPPVFNMTTWIGGLTEHAFQPMNVPYDFINNSTFFAKSLMSEEITDAGWKAFKDFYNEKAINHTRNWFVEVDAHGGLSSAVSQMPADETSYAQRKAVLKWQFYDRMWGEHANDPWPKGGVKFMNKWMKALTENIDMDTYGMYYGYPDTALSSSEAHHEYYLNHYSRLSSIKSSVDPDLVFANPQSINRND